MIVVCDTSPLRSLQALDHLGLVGMLYGEVFIPPAVVRELAVPVPGLGPLPASAVPGSVVRSPADASLTMRLKIGLGEGEAEAISAAIETGAVVLLDDLNARRTAARLGLRSTGVLAVLVQAKKHGIIASVGDCIAGLESRIRFRCSRAVRESVLRDAGEPVE